MPEKAIWVGYQKGMEKLFPKVDLEFKHPEEILFAANENHLVIAGRDRWDPDFLNVPSGMIEQGMSRRGDVQGVQMEYGTANAVYEFLHDKLGVRWL